MDKTKLPSASIAEKTLALMQEHGVDPQPQAYAVWFTYSQGKNPALIQAIDMALAQKLPLTPSMHKNLNEQFVQAQEKEQVLDMAAQGARKLLGEVHRLVGEFSGETTEYSQELDKHVEEMSTKLGDNPDIKELIQGIAASAGNLRAQSAKVNAKLESSQKEIDELRQSLTKVTSEASRDHLTGVANRKAFDRHIKEYAQNSRAEKSELCLLMLDVDHFKKFNDNYGHLIGDEVLKIVAKSLTDSVRGKDIVARYGGEEFSLLLPNTPIKGGKIVAETIRKTIAGRDLKRRDTGESFGIVTVSIGVSQYREGEGMDIFTARADAALYAAKHAGRNQVMGEDEATPKDTGVKAAKA